MSFRITNLNNVLSAAQSTPWAILPEKLHSIAEVLSFRTSETPLTAEEIEARIGESRRDTRPAASAGDVAVIPLYGSIFPRANMMTERSGATSLQSWLSQFKAAASNPDVSAIVLDVDSPGGVTSGIPEAADAIHAARQQKPVIAVANTLMASAAYWLGSQADEVVASPSADVGSVGVYAMHVDYSRAVANDGVQTTLIRAGRFKAESSPYQPLTTEARAEMQARVDEAYDQFVNAIARGRGVSAEKVRANYGEGRVLSARNALSAGMVDRIATLDDIVAMHTKKPAKGRRYASAEIPENNATTEVALHVSTELASEASAGSSDAVTDTRTEPAPQAEETTVSTTATTAPNGATNDDRVSRLADLAELRPEAAHRLPTWIREGTTYEAARAEIAAGIKAPTPAVSGVHERATDEPWESFGHFAAAVYNAGRPDGRAAADPRLFATATGINQASPSEGGFAVPGQYSSKMWEGLFSEPTSLLSMTDNYDVEGAFIEFPRIEDTTRATGTVFGGVQAYWLAEASQLTGSKPKFGNMRLEPQELAALVYVTEKHLNNSPLAMGQYIDRMGRGAIALKVNGALVEGDGVGKPKGITTSGCKIDVAKETSQAAATILPRNISKMKARRIASVASQYVWLANTDVQTELDTMATVITNVAGSENVGGVSSPLYNSDSNRLGGLPIIWNDHCSALGTTGDLILVHLPSYAVGLRRGGVKAAQSMHLRFDYAEMAFRFMFDIDGQSWLHTKLTPAKGTDKSTIITLATRA